MIAIVSLFREALDLLEEFEKFTGPVKVLFVAAPPSRQRFEDVLASLQAVPVFDMADFDQLRDVFVVRKAVMKASSLAETFGTANWEKAKINAELGPEVAVVKRSVDRAIKATLPHTQNKTYGRRLKDAVLGPR